MKTTDETFVVDRPAFSDRGDSVVPRLAVVPPPDPDDAKRADEMTDGDLLRESGVVEPFYSTSETAEFFDRSNQWLYWGLREGVFCDENGVPLTPDRLGDPSKGRRRFTLPLIRQILVSSYARGNIDAQQLKTVTRRIKLTEEGIEWREREGWRYAHLGRNRWRWIRPEEAWYNRKANEWQPRKKTERRSGDD